MAKYQVTRGATSVMIRVFIQDSTSPTGAGLTGLTSASTNLQVSALRELSSAVEVYSGADFEAQTTIGTYQAPTASTNIRFKAVDGTNMPGWYELQFHNSCAQGFGTGDASRYVNIHIFEITTTALHIVPLPIEIELVATTNQTADPTVAQIATAVWQDTTAGDFTVSSSIGKSLYTSGVAPGASGGLFIAGSNAATTVNFTGNITGNLSGSVGSVTTKTGYSLASTGLDLVLVAGQTLPAAVRIIGAATGGNCTITGTSIVFKDFADTTTISGTMDSSGNRSGATYS